MQRFDNFRKEDNQRRPTVQQALQESINLPFVRLLRDVVRYSLYERVEDAKSPALKPNMSIVDRDEMLDLLDELRAALPVEVKRAQELLAAREKFIEDTKHEAERMLRDAELEAKTKVSESEVLYAAREMSRQMIARAEERSRQLYQVANE